MNIRLEKFLNLRGTVNENLFITHSLDSLTKSQIDFDSKSNVQ